MSNIADNRYKATFRREIGRRNASSGWRAVAREMEEDEQGRKDCLLDVRLCSYSVCWISGAQKIIELRF
ncbi:hypothetical protein [Paraburkholderia antibiotica]|uniref:Uncharacterized protein n=1 Tax=Paraburkholderia antibiotica TaxID=2728839 RepID=A0A7X9ZYP1_9BURK|nr:hypothetical protein [Paraburkholderia antibiotica]NML33006.1 hypothetical protein [Paraburkholderia antibiotica]